MSNPNAQLNTPITLERDCQAVLIPSGESITLMAGAVVFITQALGDSITVNMNGNLARIDGKNADALGMEVADQELHSELSADGLIDEQLVWDQLRTCYDPEIPINIVELGLIYGCKVIQVDKENDQLGGVLISMTLTAPGCGMGPILVEDIKHKVSQIPNVGFIEVDLTFDPPWSQEMMSEAARLQTGLY